MKKLLWIGLAGVVGACARTFIAQLVHVESGFPFATFGVNMIGTFLLCFITAGACRKLNVSKDLKDVVTTGFLGAFTTFSALGMETVLLVEAGRLWLAILYVGCSILGGLASGMLGFHLGGKQVKE